MAAAAPKMFTKQVLNSVTSCPFMRTGAIKTETLSMPQAVRNATAICPFLNEQSLSHPEKVFASIPLPTSLSSHPSLPSQPCEQCPVKDEVTLAKEVSSKTDKAIKVASPFVPKYDEVFSKEIQKVKSEGRYRIFADLERKVGSFPVAKCHNSQTGEVKPVVGWCSNDYLSMGQNEKVINAMVRAAKEVGTGAGGTRNISGTNHYHVLLEKELAALHKKPAALVFSSCYVANETTLTTMSKILGKESLCLSDELNHASMIQGIRNGIWEKKIYKHNDLNHLEDILKQQPLDRKKVLTYESVNSMEGSVAPMRELQFLADKYNCLSFVDEVHAVGMYGKTGAGVAERDNVEVDIISGTLGKAFGVMGGYVVGSEAYIDTMRSLCPGFIFTTAIPPPMAAALLASIQHLRSSSKERIAMHRNAHRLHSELRRIGLPMLPTISHITPVLVGDATKCKKVTDTLLNRYGIYVQPINYPTVPRGTERLRITPAPVHTEEMMNLLLKALDEIWTELELPRSYSDVIEGHEGLSDEEYGVGSASVYEHFMGEHAQDHYAFGMTSGGAVAAAA